MKNQSEALPTSNLITEKVYWDSVYQTELPRIYNYFLYKVGDREFSQDLTAMTFERAWKHRSRFQMSIASLPTWLFGIARNVLKEHFRKNNQSNHQSALWLQNNEYPANTDVEKTFLNLHEKKLLRILILELPEREQDLIALKYGAELTNREIAKITKLSESNVGSILHRTVSKLRSKMEDQN